MLHNFYPLVVAILLYAPADAATPRPEGVFHDAVAVWQLDSPDDTIQVHGNGRLGVALEGEERSASLARGGDGFAAEFNEGYLSVGSPGQLRGVRDTKTMTLCLRICDNEGTWRGPLLAIDNPADERANLLYGSKVDVSKAGYHEAARMGGGEAIEFQWRTDPSDKSQGDWGCTPDLAKGVLRLDAPIGLIGPRGWHDLVIRFTGPQLAIFVDGVLIDEEWPHGAFTGLDSRLLIGAGYEKGKLQTGFHGRIDHAAIWNRALSDDEITAISGGKEEIARRDREIFGPPNNNVQYWRPRGYNTFVGDVMAFFHNNRLHVYYLYDRRHHGSKWGSGAHQFGHMSTTDLVHWQHHPMTLPITDQTECSLGTGCFVFRDGTYYLFHIQHGRRINMKDAPYHGDNIFLATSKDGIHFTKRPEPVINIRYDHGGDINPHVLLTDATDRYIMTISGWKVFTSTNLLDWTEADFPQLRGLRWICSTDIKWNDWRYFTGWMTYVMSSKPIAETTEWTQPASQALRDSWIVPVACEFTGNRRLAIGFASGADYAHELLFRELVQEKDGSLGMKWPAEVIPKTGKPLDLPVEPLKGEAVIADQTVRLSATADLSAAVIRNMPKNARITLTARAKSGATALGVCCRGKGTYEEGCELRLEPGASRMHYSQPNGSDGPAMDGVPGLDGEITIDLIVKDDLVDACVNNRRTLLNRTSAAGDRLFLFVRNGQAEFKDLVIRPLVPDQDQSPPSGE